MEEVNISQNQWKYTYHNFMLPYVSLNFKLVQDVSTQADHFSGGSRPLLGDGLVIAGTVFFALSNVGEVSVCWEFLAIIHNFTRQLSSSFEIFHSYFSIGFRNSV